MNTTRNNIARLSSAAAIAAIFVASACGTEQPPAQSPAQQITVERHWPAKHMNRPAPAGSGQETQKVAEHVHTYLHAAGRPDSIH